MNAWSFCSRLLPVISIPWKKPGQLPWPSAGKAGTTPHFPFGKKGSRPGFSSRKGAVPISHKNLSLSKWCCCDIGQELFDLFIRNRLNDKVHFFRIVYILKVTELFPEELLVVIGAEEVF